MPPIEITAGCRIWVSIFLVFLVKLFFSIMVFYFLLSRRLSMNYAMCSGFGDVEGCIKIGVCVWFGHFHARLLFLCQRFQFQVR